MTNLVPLTFKLFGSVVLRARVVDESGNATNYLVDPKAGFSPKAGETWACEEGNVLMEDKRTGNRNVAVFPHYRVRELTLDFERKTLKGLEIIQSEEFETDGTKIVYRPDRMSQLQPKDGEMWKVHTGRTVKEEKAIGEQHGFKLIIVNLIELIAEAQPALRLVRTMNPNPRVERGTGVSIRAKSKRKGDQGMRCSKWMKLEVGARF